MRPKLSPNAQASARDLAARDGASGDVAVRDAEIINHFGQTCWAAMCEAGMMMHRISDVALANWMLQNSLSVMHSKSGAASTELAQVLVDKMRLLDGGTSPDEVTAIIRKRFQDAAEVAGAVASAKDRGAPQ